MITFLSKHRLGRILLIPVVILCGALSWFSYVDGTDNTQDAGRLKSWWGWLDPKLDPQWARFEGTESRYHLLKNIGSEWAGLDRQRAFKALSFMMVAASILAAVVGVVLL